MFQISELLIISVLFVLIIASQLIGFRVKKVQIRQNADVKEYLGSVENSLLGLLALLLSFTFSMSASKYDTRRQVIIEEVNDIGTVILRCDLYGSNDREFLRTELKEYLEARIAYYNAGTDTEKIKAALVKSDQYSRKIWNKVSDIVTTREAGNNAHVPDSIIWLLFILTLVGGFLIGHSFKGDHINWVVVIGFSLVMVMTIFIIIDLDRPRQGIINMDQTQSKMTELRGIFDN